MKKTKRIENALDLAARYGQIDGGHHKTWVIDQMVRALMNSREEYEAWVLKTNFTWDTGIAP